MKTKNKIYKIKKTAILCALLALTLILSAMLYSCDKPDIYKLAENILQNKNPDKPYSFDAVLNIKINEEYIDDAIPDELNFKIKGEFLENQAEIKISLSLEDYETTVYKYGNFFYFELNDLSRIILDLLYSTGFIDAPVKTLFDGMVEYDNGSFICFDLTDFNLSFFEKYSDDIKKIFTVKSSVKYGKATWVSSFAYLDYFDFYNDTFLLFSDIKNKIDKELLKLPRYRYIELYAVVGTDENKNNFMQILAKRENGERELLEKFTLDCDLSKVFEKPESLYSENILPMRYLFELLGENVNWDEDKKQAFVTKDEKNIYFDGKIIKSATYINLTQIMLKTDYILNSTFVDDYIEFKLSRK